MNKHICVLPGDGIGPEVTTQALRVLDAVGRKFGHTFTRQEALIGGAAIDAIGVPLPEETLKACREANPETYIRINAFDSTKGWETVRMSFIAQRPSVEPGFRLVRQETQGRQLRYTMESYAVGRNPEGARYAG